LATSSTTSGTPPIGPAASSSSSHGVPTEDKEHRLRERPLTRTGVRRVSTIRLELAAGRMRAGDGGDDPAAVAHYPPACPTLQRVSKLPRTAPGTAHSRTSGTYRTTRAAWLSETARRPGGVNGRGWDRTCRPGSPRTAPGERTVRLSDGVELCSSAPERVRG